MTIIALIIAIVLAVEITVFARERREEDLYIIAGAGLMLAVLIAYIGSVK